MGFIRRDKASYLVLKYSFNAQQFSMLVLSNNINLGL